MAGSGLVLGRSSILVRLIASFGALALITGGFHSENLMKSFEGKGMATLEISPRMTEAGEESDYQKVMMAGIGLRHVRHSGIKSPLYLRPASFDLQTRLESLRQAGVGSGDLAVPAEEFFESPRAAGRLRGMPEPARRRLLADFLSVQWARHQDEALGDVARVTAPRSEVRAISDSISNYFGKEKDSNKKRIKN